MSAGTTFVIVNLLGGISVLGGYVIGLYLFPDQREMLWGGLQGRWRIVFTVSMLIAAAGYLAFFYGIIVKSNPASFSLGFLNGYHAISILATIFLISASIWMPATLIYLKSMNSAWWIISVASLWITATSLIALTAMVVISPLAIPSVSARILAIIGISYITFHCLVFDAIIWVSRFHGR